MNTTAEHSPTAQAALQAIVTHHAALQRQLDDHVRALGESVGSSAGVAGTLARLRVFLTDSVLAHAAAEERTFYRVAAADTRLAVLVDALIAEHHTLRRWTHTLGDGRSPSRSLALAERIGGVFTVHLDKENELLLPALGRLPDIDLAALLRGMHEAMASLPDRSAGVQPMD